LNHSAPLFTPMPAKPATLLPPKPACVFTATPLTYMVTVDPSSVAAT